MARGYPDFEGGKSKVFLVPAWAAEEATDKEFNCGIVGIGGGVGFGFDFSVTYVIPAGKTLYITTLSVSNHAALAVDGDNNQFVTLSVARGIETLYVAGSNGGIHLNLDKPLVFLAGETFTLRTKSWANHFAYPFAKAFGYEV